VTCYFVLCTSNLGKVWQFTIIVKVINRKQIYAERLVGFLVIKQLQNTSYSYIDNLLDVCGAAFQKFRPMLMDNEQWAYNTINYFAFRFGSLSKVNGNISRSFPARIRSSTAHLYNNVSKLAEPMVSRKLRFMFFVIVIVSYSLHAFT